MDARGTRVRKHKLAIYRVKGKVPLLRFLRFILCVRALCGYYQFSVARCAARNITRNHQENAQQKMQKLYKKKQKKTANNLPLS